MLFFTALDFTSITSHIRSWVFFSLWLRLFILPGGISPLFSSSILGTYRSGEFIFQCPIFLPFHTVYGVLKARILKWFAIPFSSRSHSVLLELTPPKDVLFIKGNWNAKVGSQETPGVTGKFGLGVQNEAGQRLLQLLQLLLSRFSHI